ncbi:hypothetical protein HK102_011235, partial [Quaeritorhiza haematococci]
CYYPSPKRDGPYARYTQNWKCAPGRFCLSPTDGQQDPGIVCNPGFYCPQDTVQPIYCPSRYYCDANATTATRCPRGSFCPEGTVEPLSCNALANCPEGSKSANKFAIFAVFVVFAVLVWFAFRWKEKHDNLRRLKHREQIANLLKGSLTNDKTLSKLSKTFDISFDNLGLTLGNGVTIMKGVTGELKSGRSCAIMGPSGAGKTTFVTLLTGKVRRTSGTVTINGVKEELSKYKKLIGYVPQEDIMLRELTVRDILMHSARMRLPASWPFEQVKRK